MARFFLPKEKIHGSRGVIEGQELAHLGRVLRLRAGDSVTVFDDSGWEHDAVVASLSAAQGELKRLVTDQTVFAGAYHGWGFHEDGCRSGVEAAAALGSPW